VTTTLTDMINEVLINLSGYTYQQERSTHLTAAVTTLTSPSSSPTILSLGSTDNVGKGILEIDEELIWVDSFDRIANTATIAPYGRGYLGTTAATHAVDAKVTVSPIFPRYSVKRAINDTIRAVGTQLFAVKNTTFTFNAAVNTYAFNNLNIDRILRMDWQDVGPSQEWIPLRRWDFDSQADEAVWGAGAQTVTIGDYVTAGRTIKVTYVSQPDTLDNSNDDYYTTTGLPSSSKDVVILGASYRLLSFLDPARAGQISPQADETDGKRPYNASGNATKQLYALYIQRLGEEVKAQQGQYPPRVHYSR
jgi:hypothetical protein